MSDQVSKKHSAVIPNKMCEYDGEHVALKIPEILENIFKFCTFSDLRSCRRVSSSWENGAKALWLLSAYVRIQEIGKENDRKMSEYLKLATENGLLKHVNFNIILHCTVYDFSTFIPFLEWCGPRIKKLKLDVNQFPNNNSVRDILFKCCPNMTALTFSAYYVKKPASNTVEMPSRYIRLRIFVKNINENVKWIAISPQSIIYANISWMELFINYPRLEGLKLLRYITDKYVNDIFGALYTLRKSDSNKLKLKEIHALVTDDSSRVFEGITPSLLEFLLIPDVKKESISITLNNADDINSISKVLSTHANTLNILKFDTSYENLLSDADWVLQIQSMLPALCKLTLPRRVLRLLKILKYTPNLKKLVIYKRPTRGRASYSKLSEITMGADMENFRLCGLTDLTMGHYENADGIAKPIRWMPHVEILKLPLSNETFELVCHGWPNLKSLNINKSTVDECGITGLDGDHVIRINIAKGNFCNRPATVPRANITALTQLKRFHMSYELPLQITLFIFAVLLSGSWIREGSMSGKNHRSRLSCK